MHYKKICQISLSFNLCIHILKSGLGTSQTGKISQETKMTMPYFLPFSYLRSLKKIFLSQKESDFYSRKEQIYKTLVQQM